MTPSLCQECDEDVNGVPLDLGVDDYNCQEVGAQVLAHILPFRTKRDHLATLCYCTTDRYLPAWVKRRRRLKVEWIRDAKTRILSKDKDFFCV